MLPSGAMKSCVPLRGLANPRRMSCSVSKSTSQRERDVFLVYAGKISCITQERGGEAAQSVGLGSGKKVGIGGTRWGFSLTAASGVNECCPKRGHREVQGRGLSKPGGREGGPLLIPPCFSVSRESFRTFHELSEIFSDENNHSLSRELLIKVQGAPSKFVLACSTCCFHPPASCVTADRGLRLQARREEVAAGQGVL